MTLNYFYDKIEMLESRSHVDRAGLDLQLKSVFRIRITPIDQSVR